MSLTANINSRSPSTGTAVGALSTVGANVARIATDPAARLAARVRADLASVVSQASEAAAYSAEKAKQIAATAAAASWAAWTSFFGSLSVSVLVIVVTLGLLALVTYVYLKLKPTVLLPNSELVGKCPDRWILRDDGKCHPTYQTTCSAFDPELYKDTRCQIAKSCGTTWGGVCN